MVLRLLNVELRYCKVSCSVALDQLKVALDLGEGCFMSDMTEHGLLIDSSADNGK